MFLSFRHPPPTEPGYRHTRESAQSVVGQRFPVRVGETTVMGLVEHCELIEDSGELWMTMEVPDGTPWTEALMYGR